MQLALHVCSLCEHAVVINALHSWKVKFNYGEDLTMTKNIRFYSACAINYGRKSLKVQALFLFQSIPDLSWMKPPMMGSA
jgi:hypothetical protein